LKEGRPIPIASFLDEHQDFTLVYEKQYFPFDELNTACTWPSCARKSPINDQFFDLTYERLATQMVALGQKPYRAQQLFDWVYCRGVTDIEAMSDISKTFREQLKTMFSFELPTIHVRQDSSDGTVKLLLKLADGY
jgi:hypothetical protein